MMPTLACLLGIDMGEYDTFVMGRNLLGKNSGAVILPGGEIIGQTDDERHLLDAPNIANHIIKGNYFGKYLGN